MKDIAIFQKNFLNLLYREGAKLVGVANLEGVP